MSKTTETTEYLMVRIPRDQKAALKEAGGRSMTEHVVKAISFYLLAMRVLGSGPGAFVLEVKPGGR